MNAVEQNAIFESWLEQHGAILHHVANGFADGADRHDLMQELLLALWKAVPAFRGGARTSTFVYRVSHNAALTWKRAAKNYQQRIERVEAWEGSREGPTNPEPREREALEHVYAAIRRLPPLDRSLMLLHLDGVPYAEIGALHGITETNVGARLTRLKQRLTTMLEEISHELR